RSGSWRIPARQPPVRPLDVAAELLTRGREDLFGEVEVVSGVLEDVDPLGVRLHQAVLDSVVDHLDEVAGAGGPAVEIAVLGSARPLRAARAFWRVPHSGAGGAARGKHGPTPPTTAFSPPIIRQ